MASNAGSPSASDTATSPTKTKEDKPIFTDKETKLLLIAITHCLKSGQLEVNMDSFFKHGDFKTMKTASNTWCKIKSKLKSVTGAEQADGGGGEAGEVVDTPKTPKKTSPKKRTAKADADGEEEEGGESPKKRKTPSKPKKNTNQAGGGEIKKEAASDEIEGNASEVEGEAAGVKVEEEEEDEA